MRNFALKHNAPADVENYGQIALDAEFSCCHGRAGQAIVLPSCTFVPYVVVALKSLDVPSEQTTNHEGHEGTRSFHAKRPHTSLSPASYNLSDLNPGRGRSRC
jgi:hypothetical protein